MSEITKDFIKFVAEVVVFLMIISAVFSPEGIASTTVNYMTFAEPIMLQNYIATAFTSASQSPGEFYSTIKTSGDPHIIRIFESNRTHYVNAVPSSKTFTKTTFSALNPVPFLTNCIINPQEIKLKSKLDQSIRIVKKIDYTSGVCTLSIEVGETSPIRQCYDGRDNNNNGEMDYPKDKCCTSLEDDAEVTTECCDGKDNNGNGDIDAEDPLCHNDNDATNPKSYNPKINSEHS